MTHDDGTVLTRPTDVVPAPRASGQERETLWPEPGRFERGTRPRSQYWDVGSARWVSRPPVPGPRRGD